MEKSMAVQERFVEKPNLPSASVTLVMVSDAEPKVIDNLQRLGIRTIVSKLNDNLPGPIAGHADLQCLHLGKENWLVARPNPSLQEKLEQEGATVCLTQNLLGNTYPKDVLLNVFFLKELMFGKSEIWDPQVQEFCKNHKIKTIPVNQGYTNCSVAVVSERAIITADAGIAQAARKNGIQVLEIQSGNIRLDGYDYGFIGGCCGLLSNEIIAFTGNLNSHPNGFEIREFIQQQQKQIVELSKGELVDIGGILPVKETDRLSTKDF
ncbi:DUF6873 family GME fold protein [Clostridium minihomine]|uniref:DUF6873 family GME fold protein n=1 Tax=Clostridium minihomine TaxID=2045012 RepID=UPI001FB4B7F6|nr:hypothetical protein [Clostridium minihomine]